MRHSLLPMLVLGLLASCTRVSVFGHDVKNDAPRTAPAGAVASTTLPVTRFAVEFTPAARKQTDEDERFNPEQLRNAIAAELRSRKLLDLQHPGTGQVAVIQLGEFDVRANSNVVMFGRLASTGVMDGIARMQVTGGEQREFRVRVEIPMQVSRTGADRNPLKKLYRGFAEQFVDLLTGVPPRHPQGQKRAD